MAKPALCFLGIDPGMTGAAAWYFPSAPQIITVEDLPVAGNEFNPVEFSARLKQMRPDAVLIEQQGPRPETAKSVCYKIGATYGAIVGVVASLEIPLERVSPAKWKRHFSVDQDKDKSRALVLRRFPAAADKFACKKDHNRAEAALLALYAAEVVFDGWFEQELIR